MKTKRFMTTAIMLFGLSFTQAQTLTHIADSLMIKNPYPVYNIRLKTNYGSPIFKAKSTYSWVGKVVITISNDNAFYDSIIHTETMATIKTGSRWTDIIFNYKEVGHKKFET